MSFRKIKIDTADRLFSLYIRTRDMWTCQRCWRTQDPYDPASRRALHCSHFQSREAENTRYDPLNADALCGGCHEYFTKRPAEHYAWQVKNKGQDVVDRIVLASNTYHKKDRKAEILYWLQKLDEDFNITPEKVENVFGIKFRKDLTAQQVGMVT